MQHSLTVVEKFSRYWPHTTASGAILCIIVYLVSLSTDVLTTGILRLVAFILFALSVFSLLKWRDGQTTIEIDEVESKSINLIYSRRNKLIHEESIDLHDLKDVRFSNRPDRTIFSRFTMGGVSLQVKLGDSPGWIYLFVVHDRVLLLDKENAGRALSFIQRTIRK